MKHLTTIITSILIIAMAAGTVVEKIHGPAYAQAHIYHSIWFMLLWFALAVCTIMMLIKQKAYRRVVPTMLHASFALILIGALITHCFSTYGEITLKPGEATNAFTSGKEANQTVEMPFSLELDRFEVETYPGTRSPMDFVSYINVSDKQSGNESIKISMNNIYKHKEYRFYQSDYDMEGNSTLSVAHDPAGITVTYIGYALLLLSLIMLFFEREGEFRKLLKSPLLKRTAAIALLLIIATSSILAAPRTVPKETADKFGQIYVMYRGRICPMQTLAKDFTTKLTGKDNYQGLTAEQVICGWMFFYNDWVEEPMFKIKGSYVQETLGIDGKYAVYGNFIDHDGNPILDTVIKYLPKGDPKTKKYRTANEQFNLIKMLYNGKLLKIFPIADGQGSIQWISQSDRIPEYIDTAEYIYIKKQLSYWQELVVTGQYQELNNAFEKLKRYQEQNAKEVIPTATMYRSERMANKLSAGRWLPISIMMIGLLCFIYYLLRLGAGKRMNRVVRLCLVVITTITTLYALSMFILRWISGGHIPMAGGYDSMNLLALCIGLVAIIMMQRHDMALPAGLLTMGVALMVAMMSGSNPPVTHLMPVLASPLMTLHVSVIMLAYALFFLVMINGIAGLVMSYNHTNGNEPAERLRVVSLLMLYPAVALLTIGIFIGAVWANVSWGNYWSWDPKEVWALITMLVYAAPLHGSVIKTFQRPRFFHIYCIVAFLSVIITYFGVNIILGGVHSYN